MEDTDQWKEMVTFGLALLGAVLGVINTWRAVNRDRMKLRVRFVHGFSINAPHMPDKMIGVEVTNLSTFPVTIQETGLHIVASKHRAVLIPPTLLDGGDWPRRLESREQVTTYFDSAGLPRDVEYSNVFATTACGVTVRKRQSNLPKKLT